MKSHNVFRIAACAIIVALCVVGAGFPVQPVAGQVSKPVTLQGAAAIDQLKHDGQFDSLQSALDQARFSVSLSDNTPLGRWAWHAPNPKAGYDAYITETGVSIAVNDETYVSLNLKSLGYGAALRAVAPGEVSGDKQMINITRDGGVREWFINGPDGVEQGFTLAEPPGVQQAGVPLWLALQVSEGWRAAASEDGQQVTLRGDEGQAVDYSKLIVRDHEGSNIPARLKVVEGQVVIEVDDSEAAYPLTIDPLFILQQKLAAVDGVTSDRFGSAVALSGNTAVIGAVGVNSSQGSVYVFVRNNSSSTGWAFQQKLTAYDGASEDYFGSAVAISGDTLVVGVPGNSIGTKIQQGSAYVFVRSGGVWTFQQKLIAHDGAAKDFFGCAVAISGDIVAVGAYGDFAGVAVDQGSAYIFTRSSTVWSFQKKLTAYDAAEADAFGVSVALNGNGNTLVVGAPGKNADQGAAYIFTRSGTVWSFHQQVIAYSQQGDAFGFSVALDGGTLVVGAPGRNIDVNTDQGAAYVFAYNGELWDNRRTLTAPDGAAKDNFGYSVAISGDIVVVGAPWKKIDLNTDQGATYAFVRSSDGWAFQQRLTAYDGAAKDNFGYAVAMSGNIVVVGSIGDDIVPNFDRGSVYAFYRPPCPNLTFWPLFLYNGTKGSPYQQSVAVSGGAGPHQFTVSAGALPPGISLTSSGLLSGTPTTLGTYQFTLSVTDLDSLCSASRAYSITIAPCPKPILDQPDMPEGILGYTYSETLQVYPESSSYKFLVKSGLPPGLSLSAEGIFSGTPTQSGYFPFTVYITGPVGCTTAAACSITISESGTTTSAKRRKGGSQ